LPDYNRITGVARSFSSSRHYQRFFLSTTSGKGVVVIKQTTASVSLGETIRAFGHFRRIDGPTNPGQFDYGAYLASQGCSWVFQADSLMVLKGPGMILSAVGAVRRYLAGSLKATVAPEVLPLVQASLLGERHLLNDSVKQAFANSGMFHLLAISGLHVGILALILIRLGYILRLPRKAVYLVSGLLLTLYVPVSGASISIIRAVMMFWCVAFAVFRERPPFSLHNLGLTCTLCLLIMPYQILSLGFQLSFCATFFLLFYAPSISQLTASSTLRNPMVKAIVATMFISLVLFFATLPPLAASVHQVSPIAVAGNVVTLFLMACMVMTAGLSVLFYPLGQFPSVWMGEFCSLSGQALVFCVENISGFFWSHLFQPTLSWSATAWVYALLLLLPFAVKYGRLRAFTLSAVLVLCTGFATQQAYRWATSPGKIVYLDVGQGDAIFCSLPGQFTVLIDAGPGYRGRDAGKTVLLPFLKQAGVKSLDMLIISHADWDHFSGLMTLLPHVCIKRAVYPGEGGIPSHAWRRLRHRLEAQGIPLFKARCGDTLYKHRHALLTAVHPCPDDAFSNRNNNSLVVLLRLHGTRHLLTGDIEATAERILAGRLGGAVDVLKVSHHGSASGTSALLLDAAHPAFGIISAGKRNRYGHPDSAVLYRLRSKGIKILSTCETGAVTFGCSKGSCSPPETFIKHGSRR
jgi:competence protein ComEC